MRSDATPEHVRLNAATATDPVEFSVDDAILNTWVEDTSVYLRLEATEPEAIEARTPDAT